MRVAVFSQIWPDALADLCARHDCTVAINPSPERKAEVLRTAQAVVLRSPVVLDRAALEQAPELVLIVRAGTGLDSIDTAYVTERGIELVIVPHSARSVAEHTLGLIQALRRRIVQLDRSLRAGRWEKHSGIGRELHGATLGVLGFGRIGRRTAELGAACGMHVLAYDRSPQKPVKQEAAQRLEVRFVDLDTLLEAADVLTVQLPLNAGSRCLLDARRLAQLRPEAVLVNVGRGAVVDEDALYAALRDGRLAGAATDVFTREPPGATPLLELENFVATPHVGAQTEEAQRMIGERVLEVVAAAEARLASTPTREDG